MKGDLLEGANAYHCEKCNKKVCVPFLIDLCCGWLIERVRLMLVMCMAGGHSEAFTH